MQFKIAHKTTQAAAIRKIKTLLEEQKQKIAENATIETAEWDNNVLNFAFTAQGTHIKGTITVTETEFDIYAKLPLMYRLFEGKIEKAIAAEVAKFNL